MSDKPDMQVEEGKATYTTALPEQKAFFKIPARFGHVPVAEEPLGYDHESGFEGDMTVEYTFERVESGTEVTIACRVQDDLGGEGMKAMKLKVE